MSSNGSIMDDMRDMPVFTQVADLLVADPQTAYQIDISQLETILSITGLLPGDIWRIVSDIVDRRKNPIRPKIIIRPKPTPTPTPTPMPVPRPEDQEPTPQPRPRLRSRPLLAPASEPASEPASVPAPVPKLKPKPLPPPAPVPAPVPLPAPRPKSLSLLAPAPLPASKPKPRLKPVPVSSPAPTPKPRLKPVLAPSPTVPQIQLKPKPHILPGKTNLYSLIRSLNENYQRATEMTDEELRSVLEWADNIYYNGESSGDDSPELDDRVYDYIKRMYNERIYKTKDVTVTMKSLSSTGVGADLKPSRERDVALPFYLGSLDNLFKGEGHVSQWTSGHSGPYHISAKMDGTSALYHDGGLFTRGNAQMGRDISHILKYIGSGRGLPDVPYSVRGEIVMKKSTFDQKYKGKKSSFGRIRKVNRNSVSGALGGINNIDYEFLGDLDFVAYEILEDGQQRAPSVQFGRLEADGFQTAYNMSVRVLDDAYLASVYDWIIKDYDYIADGVVVRVDAPYSLAVGKNPDYAKAFKDPLPQDTAVTRVIRVEWNPSQHGYLIPTVVYEPVFIHGVELQRTTGHNARDIEAKGLGPGAEIEVIYWGMVNPRVNKVLVPVKPSFPENLTYEWTVNDKGERVNIKLVMTEEGPSEDGDDPLHTVLIQKVHKSLEEIGAKGIGEGIIRKIYTSQPHMRTVGDFFNIRIQDTSVLGGGTASRNVVESIHGALSRTDLPTLMAASKVFARGLGAKKFSKVFEVYPDFISDRRSRDEYYRMFMGIDGFADKTSSQAADGMMAFWTFVDKYINDSVMAKIIDNTRTDISLSVEESHPDIVGKKICITGFRDAAIADFIKENGGIIQTGFSGATNLIIRRDDGYTNTKIAGAVSKGVRIVSKDTFIRTYMS